MMGWGNQGYGMGWFGGIFMFLFWLVVIVAIVLAIRYLTTGKVSPSERAQSDPLKILQERYARGEIDTEEYEERKKALQSGT
jgi:putative membrane protein